MQFLNCYQVWMIGGKSLFWMEHEKLLTCMPLFPVFCFYFSVSLSIPFCIPCLLFLFSLPFAVFFCLSFSLFPPSLRTIFVSLLSFCFICLSLFQCLFLINLLAWFFLSHLCLSCFLFLLVSLLNLSLCVSLFLSFVFLYFCLFQSDWECEVEGAGTLWRRIFIKNDKKLFFITTKNNFAIHSPYIQLLIESPECKLRAHLTQRRLVRIQMVLLFSLGHVINVTVG